MAAEFEIHVNRGGRWSIESAESNEKDAIAAARRRVGMPGVEAVKVVTEVTSRLGRVSENVVFEQQGRVGDTGIITVAPIDAPPKRCESSSDLYGGNARLTMAKLFRNYSSKMNLTVSEVLYNARELKRVMEKDNLLSSAVSKVASLQAGAGAAEAKERRDELFSMIDEVVARANAAEKAKLPSIAAVGLKALEEAVSGSAGDAREREYLIRVAISRELMGERSFLGKLENAVKWAEGVEPDVAVDALDEFIADTLTDATVIQDVLGRRDNLLAAVLAMLDLLDGQLTLAESAATAPGADAGATGERLNKLIGASRLPGAVAVIADRVQSMVASRNPLVREAEPKEEEAAFRALVERLIPADAPVRASGDILMALIERAGRMINKGGETGRNEAVAYITGRLLEPARKVRFLLAAYEAAPQDGLKAHIVALTKGWIGDTRAATDFNPQSKNPALVMRAVTNLFYHVRDAAQPELAQPLTGHLENLLFDYVDKAQILQMVDDPNRPLRARARLLMSMCLPDMLPPGKAVEAARQRVVAYLRQPDFTSKVVEDLSDPAEKEKALRELFDLMKRAGFK